jgi:hypothetical protein
VELLRAEVANLRGLISQLETGCSECWWQNWVLLWLNRGLTLCLVFLVVTIYTGYWTGFRKRLVPISLGLEDVNSAAQSDSDCTPTTLGLASATSSRKGGPTRPSDRLKRRDG